MREAFRTSVYLKAKTLTLIEQSNKVIAEYQADGYVITLRQLYYQLVARGLLDNIHGNYKKLIAAVGQGRMNGLIDWDAIEDRVRGVSGFPEFDAPADLMQNIHKHYSEDLWKDQDNFVLILSEKDAVSNVIDRACQEWRVSSMMCRGYASLSALYELGKQLAHMQRQGKNVCVIHLGDHDPSGQDMTRDNEKRLRLFMDDPGFKLERIALNMDQVKEYNPPPAPAKGSDSRTPGYIAKHGTLVWELDALRPQIIVDLVSDKIRKLCDVPKFKIASAIEKRNRAEMEFVGQNYEKARNLLLWSEHNNEQ